MKDYEFDFKLLSDELEKCLSEKRFQHTLGVAYTAATMAFMYDVDSHNAFIAGMLHDCAKCLPIEEQLEICKSGKYEVSDTERVNTGLLHSKAGSILAKDKYNITNQEILSAIKFHTTGQPAMTDLEKIIFIADFIEPNRKMIIDLPEIRKEAYQDLNKCVTHILKNTLSYLNEKDAVKDDMTQKTYEYYVRLGA